MAIAKLDQVSLYYEVEGQGKPLVLVSGFSADHTTWRLVAPLLAKHFKVITFDNRGAGQSTVPEGEYEIGELAQDVALLCRELKIDKANFIGNSMGGYIVQTLAHQYPNLVEKVIISNSALGGDTCFKQYLEAQLALLKAEAPIEALIKATACWVYSKYYLADPENMQAILRQILENPFPFTLTGYEGQFAALKKFNAKPWVKEINVPAMVFGADEDIIFYSNMIKAIADEIPAAKYYEFSRCGHLPHIEQPQEYVKQVLRFLE